MYSNSLRRVIATAQIIADEARVPDVRILHGLTNVDYGAWEGMTAEEAAMYDPEAFALYRTSPSRASCPMGERLSDAQKRMIEALQLIGSRHAGETVAAVTHAVMIRLVVAKLNGTGDESWRIPVGRGSLTEFQIDKGSIRLTSLPEGSDVDRTSRSLCRRRTGGRVDAVTAIAHASAPVALPVFAVIATACVFAVVQSIFGVGLLLFGTPTLTLLGLPFQLVLAYLLPCSIAATALQVVTSGGLTLEPIRRRFLVFTAPAVFFATGTALLLGSPHQIRAILGAVLLLTATLRLSPYQTALAAFVRRHMRPLLVTLGLVHGLSNLGGGLLTVIVGSSYSDKASIRRHIAFAYGMMASIQLALVFATTRPHADVRLMLLLVQL